MECAGIQFKNGWAAEVIELSHHTDRQTIYDSNIEQVVLDFNQDLAGTIIEQYFIVTKAVSDAVEGDNLIAILFRIVEQLGNRYIGA